MSTLYLVRHGQASFGKEDYDQLSPLGYEQAQITGQYLSKVTAPSIFISGTLKRQRQTLTEVKKGFSETVLQSARFLEFKEFNEFDHKNILEVVYPDIRIKHKTMLERLTTCEQSFNDFQVMYKAALEKWVNNDGCFAESFEQFNQRIAQGLKEIKSLSMQGDIILVSSAGPISTCMQYGCELAADAAFWLCEEMINTGISALRLNDQNDARLSYFNNFQHLVFADSEVTYR